MMNNNINMSELKWLYRCFIIRMMQQRTNTIYFIRIIKSGGSDRRVELILNLNHDQLLIKGLFPVHRDV